MKRSAWAVGIIGVILAAIVRPGQLDARADQTASAQIQSIDSRTERGEQLVVRSVSPQSKRVTFAATQGAGILLHGVEGAPPDERALRFIDEYGQPFGLNSRRDAHVLRSSPIDELGLEHVRVQQLHRGVPVMGGQLVVHLHGARVMAVNGRTLDVLPDDVTPEIAPDAARQEARRLIEKHSSTTAVQYSEPRLEIFNRGMLDRMSTPSQLAWFIEATGEDLREYIWVDAKSGGLLLNFSQMPHAKNRQIHDANGGSDPDVNALARSEGQGPTGIADVDHAYDFSGHAYDYFFNTHGRDGMNGSGNASVAIVRVADPTRCPTAWWTGQRMAFCPGYAAADDIVGHEYTHGVIQFSADLSNYGEGGSLAEAYADIFGETVDLLNGAGTDGPAQRWLVGEDLSSGAIRNMMTPTAMKHPGKMSDSQYFDCDFVNDGSHLHNNSGPVNHAYALMVDGGTYNGYSIGGIGLTKAARVYYRALTVYLTNTAGFLDNFNALTQACTDLVGTGGMTTSDCVQVTNATLAVEMQAAFACVAPQAQPALCPSGGTPNYQFFDSFENGDGAWTKTTVTGPGTWSLHPVPSGQGHWAIWGNEPDVVSDHRIAMSSSFVVPAGGRMAFDQFFTFEIDRLAEYFYFDGGVIEYSTNGGASWADAGGFIDGGVAYGGVIDSQFSNPLSGRSAFVGGTLNYRRTRLNLSSLAGQSVRFRFRFGTDTSVAGAGWIIDNVGLYSCPVNAGAPTITSSPANQTVATGATVNLTVGATGSGLSYQWLKDDVDIPGATAAQLTLTNVQSTDSGTYRVIVSNPSGTANANPALLTVITPGTWGGTTTQNRSFGFTVGGGVQNLSNVIASAQYACTTTGTTVVATIPISGNSFSHDTGAPTCGLRVQVKGQFTSAGAAQGTAIMTIHSDASCAIGCDGSNIAVGWSATAGAPAISSQPKDRSAAAGGTVVFGVDATGTPAPAYQWQISTDGGTSYNNLTNVAPYSGVTTSTLTVTGVSPGLNGARYRAVVSNAAGSATSDGARLAILASEFVQNGTFSNGIANWLLFATPDTTHIVWQIVGGVFQYYRQPPAGGGVNQAVIFQETGVAVAENVPLAAQFDLGNSDSVRKRVSVLMIDSDFSDIAVCTFWLPPGSPLRTYRMRTHTTKPWANASIYFYAASPGSSGGHYLLDNVSVQPSPGGAITRTDCVDPLAPLPPGGAASFDLMTNGNFEAGLTGWITFGQITHQIMQGVFEFVRPAGAPSGVVLQPTGAPTSTGEIIEAKFDLGNSSAVRKRVTVILHDLNFSDMQACTFWAPPGLALSTFTMRIYVAQGWSNATVSFYPATVGTQPWMRLDNVRLKRTPSGPVLGTECIEPAVVISPSGLSATAGATVQSRGSPRK
jgi:Zn-dependent metalloprotease